MRFFAVTIISLILNLSIYSDSTLDFSSRPVSELNFTPYKAEGYLQGWNYFFRNKDYIIFSNFIISNMAPGDLNNGVSIAIQSAKTGNIFITKEFAAKDLKAERNILLINSYNNSLKYENGVFEVSQFYGDIKFYMQFYSDGKGTSLSGGKVIVKDTDKYVRADIPFSFTKAKGFLEYKGEVIPLEGKGGMEHLLTNYEVYKFSSRWEIHRASNSNGFKLFTGGFISSKKSGIDSFKSLVIQNAKGEILLADKVTGTETISSSLDPFSGYTLPVKEIFTMQEGCTITSERYADAGKINILANISRFLQFFIKLFFANPYQINYLTKITVNCPDLVKENLTEFYGIQSYFLVNPK